MVILEESIICIFCSEDGSNIFNRNISNNLHDYVRFQVLTAVSTNMTLLGC